MHEQQKTAKGYRTLRLILGDQLNGAHSWFASRSDDVLYVMMEVRSETDYAWHHIQKVCAFFAAMERFAAHLREEGHDVVYLSLDSPENRQAITRNCDVLLQRHGISRFEYQLPDEHRLDRLLGEYCESLHIAWEAFDSEHFYTSREEMGNFFEGRKAILMESFYRHMRKKHHVLMDGSLPEGGAWNFDVQNRKKLPRGHKPLPPLLFSNDLTVHRARIEAAGVKTIGTMERYCGWPLDRQQALELLSHFIDNCLPLFGTFQDAMQADEWSLYHSRLSFSLNIKILSPQEVVGRAVAAWGKGNGIAINQVEGFVRQILGWREYMRGIYWMVPELNALNFFGNARSLPKWYWTGDTRMNCLRQSIGQSLEHAYAHHIQRLMVTGNFALIAGIEPGEVDAWYLGIYADAIEWAELPNTRGMSQFGDGGITASKPYAASANYIDKMSDYCRGCQYDHGLRHGAGSCPLNSLYWDFFDRNRSKLEGNPRIGMAYRIWDKMAPGEQAATLEQAAAYLAKMDRL
ncbi:cryptochrome/photolyase family protein [uncultured Flavobacterium sp.]|uniref:cryptochrome/photolyase family protein n=1 Tax=uncultured Flavobacterium sp. TaxID=165435 RepID=UPI0025F00D1C|nr:cryptochrome/photolyase family protein [uncultured Flavobacterium sp.]